MDRDQEARWQRAVERTARAQVALGRAARGALASDPVPPPRWVFSGDRGPDGLAAVRAAQEGLARLQAYCIHYGDSAAHSAVCRLLRQLGELHGAILEGENQ